MDIKNIMQNRNHTLAVFADYFVLPYFSLYPYYNPNRVFWPDFGGFFQKTSILSVTFL